MTKLPPLAFARRPSLATCSGATGPSVRPGRTFSLSFPSPIPILFLSPPLFLSVALSLYVSFFFPFLLLFLFLFLFFLLSLLLFFLSFSLYILFALCAWCSQLYMRALRLLEPAGAARSQSVVNDTRLEVVANGLPLWNGRQLAVHTTLVSPSSGPGMPNRRGGRNAGATLALSLPKVFAVRSLPFGCPRCGGWRAVERGSGILCACPCPRQGMGSACAVRASVTRSFRLTLPSSPPVPGGAPRGFAVRRGPSHLQHPSGRHELASRPTDLCFFCFSRAFSRLQATYIPAAPGCA